MVHCLVPPAAGEERGGVWKRREGRGGDEGVGGREGTREGAEGSLCVFVCTFVSTDVKYMYEIRVVCTNGSC